MEGFLFVVSETNKISKFSIENNELENELQIPCKWESPIIK